MHRLLLETGQTGESGGGGGGNRTSDGHYIGESNFDASMVIILAALLCTLICALGLNSIIRIVLRCGWRFAAQGETAAAATGLKRRELQRIPVAAYGSNEAVNVTATECAICLGEFADGETVRVLPKCNHSFHVRCIDTWLRSHSSCPNCRHSVMGAGSEETVGSGRSDSRV